MSFYKNKLIILKISLLKIMFCNLFQLIMLFSMIIMSWFKKKSFSKKKDCKSVFKNNLFIKNYNKLIKNLI